MSDDSNPPPAEHTGSGLEAETERVYRSALERYRRWALLRDDEPASPRTLADFLTEHALRYSEPALRRVIDAAAHWHNEHGRSSPADHEDVKRVWEEVRRLKRERERDRSVGTLPEERVIPEAFLSARLRTMLKALPDDLGGHRDRVAILAGAAGGLTRTELIRLEVGDVEDTVDDAGNIRGGALLRIYPPKEKRGSDWVVRSVRVEPAPDLDLGHAYETWIGESGIHEGPLLRGVNQKGEVSERGLSVRSLNLLLDRAADRVGLESGGYLNEVRRAVA